MAAPVSGLKTTLESSNALSGSLSEGLGHLLDSPDDWGVGRNRQDCVITGL